MLPKPKLQILWVALLVLTSLVLLSFISSVVATILGMGLVSCLAAVFVFVGLSLPFVIWYALDQGKKVYISLFLLYLAGLILNQTTQSIQPPLSSELGLLVPLIFFSLVGGLLLAVNQYIIRRHWERKKDKKSAASSDKFKRILVKFLIISVGCLIFFATYKSFNGWFPSLELKELKYQEQVLQLPAADIHHESDFGCMADYFEDENQCSPSTIERSYKDTGLESLLKSRLQAQGWTSLKYQVDPQATSIIHMRSYLFKKHTSQGEFCARINVEYNKNYKKSGPWILSFYLTGDKYTRCSY